MTLHILRHAETDFNRQGIIQGSSVDTDINELGRQQAAAFYQTYQDIDFDLVVTSALKRTHQTVQLFIDKGLPWIQMPEINEIRWGDHEGQKVNEHWTGMWQQVRVRWNAGDLTANMPGGESAAELNARLLYFLDWIKTRPEKQILVCTHGRTLRGLITLLKNVTLADMESYSHANTGLYIVTWQDGAWHFETENSVAHLS
jgi:phosphoserine phosphatase